MALTWRIRERGLRGTYGLRHLVIAWVSIHLFDKLTYTVRSGPLKGCKRKGGLGWLPAVRQTFSKEEKFLSSLDLSNLVVYDVGAFHGLMTMLFASTAKLVVSFEPNHKNRQRLLENLKLNRYANVDVHAVGLGRSREWSVLSVTPLAPGTATLDHQISNGLGAKTLREEVLIVSLDEQVKRAALPTPDFLKIDVEGFELQVLQGAEATLRQAQPALFLEMHGSDAADKERRIREIVAYLQKLGYSSIKHVESGSSLTYENASLGAEGHIFCRAAASPMNLVHDPVASPQTVSLNLPEFCH